MGRSPIGSSALASTPASRAMRSLASPPAHTTAVPVSPLRADGTPLPAGFALMARFYRGLADVPTPVGPPERFGWAHVRTLPGSRPARAPRWGPGPERHRARSEARLTHVHLGSPTGLNVDGGDVGRVPGRHDDDLVHARAHVTQLEPAAAAGQRPDLAAVDERLPPADVALHEDRAELRLHARCDAAVLSGTGTEGHRRGLVPGELEARGVRPVVEADGARRRRAHVAAVDVHVGPAGRAGEGHRAGASLGLQACVDVEHLTAAQVHAGAERFVPVELDANAVGTRAGAEPQRGVPDELAVEVDVGAGRRRGEAQGAELRLLR